MYYNCKQSLLREGAMYPAVISVDIGNMYVFFRLEILFSFLKHI